MRTPSTRGPERGPEPLASSRVPVPAASVAAQPVAAAALPSISLPRRSRQTESWLRRRRYAMDTTVTVLAVVSTGVVLIPLVAILGYLIFKGASSLNVAFFTHIPAPVGQAGGGMANAIVGFRRCARHGQRDGHSAGYWRRCVPGRVWPWWFVWQHRALHRRCAERGALDCDGIAAYALIVAHQHHFSAFAGGVALAIMMVPTITRTTEEMLATVPSSLREAALGAGCAEVEDHSLAISLRTASPGIITGCMLAFARVAGETAPLLFTALGNQFWSLQS